MVKRESRKSSNCLKRIIKPSKKSKMNKQTRTRTLKTTKRINPKKMRVIQKRKKNLMMPLRMKSRKLLKKSKPRLLRKRLQKKLKN